MINDNGKCKTPIPKYWILFTKQFTRRCDEASNTVVHFMLTRHENCSKNQTKGMGKLFKCCTAAWLSLDHEKQILTISIRCVKIIHKQKGFSSQYKEAILL